MDNTPPHLSKQVFLDLKFQTAPERVSELKEAGTKSLLPVFMLMLPAISLLPSSTLWWPKKVFPLVAAPWHGTLLQNSRVIRSEPMKVPLKVSCKKLNTSSLSSQRAKGNNCFYQSPSGPLCSSSCPGSSSSSSCCANSCSTANSSADVLASKADTASWGIEIRYWTASTVRHDLKTHQMGT